MGRIKLNLSRVDYQVSLLTAVMVFLASFLAFCICYTFTYSDMIKSLNDRVMSIYTYLEANLDKQSFTTIEQQSDMGSPVYTKAKDMLEEIKNTSGVMYLYTAKQNANGDLVYIIDGLDYAASDFRYPGDLIEMEIQGDLHRALAGEEVWPSKIMPTDWGKIFITYLPIHDIDDKGEILGVVGIEFEAEHQYFIYKALLIMIPFISLVLCALAVSISSFAFRRISNPSYSNLANTDSATSLKNRNAFQVDLNNMNARHHHECIGVVVVDLNDLKKVNDTLGHHKGDQYIELAASVLKGGCDENAVCYRIGGDEFVAIMRKATLCKLNELVAHIHGELLKEQEAFGSDISASVGYAVFEEKLDEDLANTFKRADRAMYENKKAYHAKRDG